MCVFWYIVQRTLGKNLSPSKSVKVMSSKVDSSSVSCMVPSYHMFLYVLELIFVFEMFLITGWDEGVMGMQIGEVARLRVR